MRYLKWGAVGVLSVLLVAFACQVTRVCGDPDPDKQDGETDEAAIKRRVYASVPKEEDKRFTRKKAPKKGEWLASFPEKPQSFDHYLASARVRPTEKRRTIVLQPLGEMNAEQKKMLEDLRVYSEAFFQLPTRIEKSLALKLDKKDFTRNVPMGIRRDANIVQYNADLILDSILIKRLPSDAVTYLGITMEDLYSGELNYVFGLGSMQQRVGVYSLVRYFPEFWNQQRTADSEKKALLRACKVLNHEAGHMFGIPHCVFYDCSMNGSISLQETDSAPVHFCPVCNRKLRWNIGYNQAKQFADLAAFYAKHEMKDEADFMKSSIELLNETAKVDTLKKVNDE